MSWTRRCWTRRCWTVDLGQAERIDGDLDEHFHRREPEPRTWTGNSRPATAQPRSNLGSNLDRQHSTSRHKGSQPPSIASWHPRGPIFSRLWNFLHRERPTSSRRAFAARPFRDRGPEDRAITRETPSGTANAPPWRKLPSVGAPPPPASVSREVRSDPDGCQERRPERHAARSRVTVARVPLSVSGRTRFPPASASGRCGRARGPTKGSERVRPSAGNRRTHV